MKKSIILDKNLFFELLLILSYFRHKHNFLTQYFVLLKKFLAL